MTNVIGFKIGRNQLDGSSTNINIVNNTGNLKINQLAGEGNKI